MKSRISSDDSLVVRLRAGGDEEAVRRLVEQYGSRLLSAAALLCGNPADAEDLMVETLRRIVRDIGRFRGASSLFSWLYGILFNLNRMLLRSRSRSRLIYMDTLPETPDVRPHPDEALDVADAADCLAAAVRQLSEPLQAVVLLRYYGEMSIADVAETLIIPPGTVKSSLFSATARLRELLPEDFRARFQ